MTIGSSKGNLSSSIKRDLKRKSPSLPDETVNAIAEAVSEAIDKNNKELEKTLRRKLDDF